jgi:hypothetical protein
MDKPKWFAAKWPSKRGIVMKRLFVVLLTVALLTGCKASDVELRVSTEDIQNALAGEPVSVRFIARFEKYGELDADQRGQLNQIETIVESALDVDDYNMVFANSKTSITVEGEIPLHVGAPGSNPNPFALYVWPVENELLPVFTHALQVSLGEGFSNLQSQMKGVSYMMAIDAVQPIMYRIRANSGVDTPILAGGGQIDGNSFVVRAFPLADGDRVNITFKGGAYDTVYGGLMIGLPEAAQ